MVSRGVGGIQRQASFIGVVVALLLCLANCASSAEDSEASRTAQSEVALSGNTLYRREASALLVSTSAAHFPSSKPEKSGWHIAQDPDKAAVDRYTAMSCLFHGSRKVYCPENGLGSFSISKRRGRILAWGAGAFHVPDWRTKVVTILDLEGKILKEWKTDDAFAFKGAEAPDQDLFIAAYQTDSSTTSGKGTVHLHAFNYAGDTRWHKKFADTLLGDFGMSAEGNYVVLLLGSPARGGKSLLLDSSGAVRAEYGPVTSFAFAPNESWVLFWNAGQATLHGLRQGKRVLSASFSQGDRRRVWFGGASSDGNLLAILASSAGDPSKGVSPRTDSVQVVDLRRGLILKAPLNGHDTMAFVSARFKESGNLCLTFGGHEYEYEIATQ